jgi:glycosyltransferase involved in cell wall biosynthesis
MTAKTIPIFVISYNRGSTLAAVIDSYLRLSSAIEVIVHDNGSDNPATLESLQELRRAGVTVVNAAKIRDKSELCSVNDTIRRHFHGTPTSDYVVTDCDVDMTIAAPDAVAVYTELLEMFPQAECVGPMLRIRDIPRDYPLFNQAMNRHIKQFWHRRPQWVDTSAGRIAVLHAPIDTTFAVHRAGHDFRRFKQGLRVYLPYEARHLDWYLTDKDYASDPYAQTSSDAISHWRNRSRREQNKHVDLRYEGFFYVDHDEHGTLTTKQATLSPTPRKS